MEINEPTKWKKKFFLFRLKVLIEGNRTEAENMLQDIGGTDRSSQELITQLVVFKK